MELIKINPEQFGLSEIQATAIANKFLPILEEMQPHLEKYAEIKDLDPADSANSSKFKELRLKLVKCRTNAAKIHKEEKAYYLAGGKYVDSYKNEQLKITEPIEADLAEKEKYAEIQEQKRKDQLRADRSEQLKKFNYEDSNSVFLGEMSEAIFASVLLGAEKAYNDAIELEKQAEKARLEREQYEAERQQEEMIWALYYQRIADSEAAEEKAAAAIKKVQQDKEDAEYLAEYNIWQEYEKHLTAEREKADRLMFGNKAEQYLHDSGFDLINGLYQSKKYGFSLSPHYYNDLLSYSHFSSFKNQIDRLNKEAEREAELKAENERKAEAEKQRLATLAPDKDKLTKYANELRSVKTPELSQQESKEKLNRFFVKMKLAIAELQ